MSYAIISDDPQIIRELLCGPIQHNEHVKGWRWKQYVGDSNARWENVKAELRRMHGEDRDAH